MPSTLSLLLFPALLLVLPFLSLGSAQSSGNVIYQQFSGMNCQPPASNHTLPLSTCIPASSAPGFVPPRFNTASLYVQYFSDTMGWNISVWENMGLPEGCNAWPNYILSWEGDGCNGENYQFIGPAPPSPCTLSVFTDKACQTGGTTVPLYPSECVLNDCTYCPMPGMGMWGSALFEKQMGNTYIYTLYNDTLCESPMPPPGGSLEGEINQCEYQITAFSMLVQCQNEVTNN